MFEDIISLKVLRFARLLRKYGIRVTCSEIADALTAISNVGLDKEDLKRALACTLIKDQKDMKLFNSLFQFFFSPPNPIEKPESDTGESLYKYDARSLTQGETKMIESAQGMGVLMEDRFMSDLQGPLYLLLVRAVKTGDYRLMQFLAHKAVEGLGNIDPKKDDVRDLLRRAKSNIGWDKAIPLIFGPQYTF